MVKSVIVQLITLIVVGGAANYGLTTLGPLQETIRLALGLTDTQMSLLQGPALYLPPILLGVPVGLLIDRLPRARLLVVFTALEVGGGLLLAGAPGFAVLVLARALSGAATTAIAMNASALVAEITRPEQRGRTLMLLGMLQIACMSLAFALGGDFVALYGVQPNGWRWAALWLTVPQGLVFLLSFWIREPAHAQVGALHKTTIREACIALWRYRAMLLTLSFGLVIAAMGYMAALAWSAPMLTRSFHLQPDRTGAVMSSVLLISGVLGGSLGGMLVDLCQRTGGPRRIISLMAGIALLQIPAAAYGLATKLWVFVVLLTLLCTTAYMKGIITSAATTIVIPEQLMGLSFGVMNVLSSILASVAPVATSVLAERVGGPMALGQAMAAVCATTSLAALATFAYGRRYFPGLERIATRIEPVPEG